MVPTFRPGLTSRMTYDEYAALEGARFSHLKRMKWSPAHVRQSIVSPSKSTPALSLGHAVHAAILEPDLFMEEFAAAPKVDKRTKAGKATWLEFQSQNASKEIITDLEFETCIRFSEACWAHPIASEILKGAGQNEVVGRWQVGNTICKARYDRITSLADWSIVGDIKTTQDAREWAFSGAIAKYSYHLQAAWYLDGLNAISPRQRKFVFLVLEKQPPWGIKCYLLDDISIEQGRDENRKNLKAYEHCVETGKWPGYETELKTISVPDYAIHAEEWEG